MIIYIDWRNMTNSEVIELLKVLSDENRLKIIKLLAKHNICACNILKELKVTQPTLSHHMKVLSSIHLVTPIKKGNKVVYQLEKSKLNKISLYMKEIIGGENMKKEEMCDKKCTCGCHEGKECTCDDKCNCGPECTCGCNSNKEKCDESCSCGCNEGKECNCE